MTKKSDGRVPGWASRQATLVVFDIGGIVAGVALALYAVVTRSERLLAYRPEYVLTAPAPPVPEGQYYLWLAGCFGGFVAGVLVSAALVRLLPVTRFPVTAAWTFFLVMVAVMTAVRFYWTAFGP
jgi:hypothetical protein